MQITKAGPALANVGDEVTYEVVISNISSADTPALVLDSFADTLVAGVVAPAACSPLASGASCNFTYTYVVPSGAPDPLVNVATVHYHPDGYPNDIWDEDDHSVNLFQASVTIDKTGDGLSKVGDDVSYTITVTNTSSADTPALNCTVTDALLEISKQVVLASGASDVTIATYTVLQGASEKDYV